VVAGEDSQAKKSLHNVKMGQKKKKEGIHVFFISYAVWRLKKHRQETSN